MLRIVIRKPFREEPALAQQASPGAAAALRAHGQGGYFVSASGVSAPPYGRQEPSEIVVEQLRCGIVVPIRHRRRSLANGCVNPKTRSSMGATEFCPGADQHRTKDGRNIGGVNGEGRFCER